MKLIKINNVSTVSLEYATGKNGFIGALIRGYKCLLRRNDDYSGYKFIVLEPCTEHYNSYIGTGEETIESLIKRFDEGNNIFFFKDLKELSEWFAS